MKTMVMIGDIGQAALVTSALILAGRALVAGIKNEYVEIITYWRNR
ncbi:hypothetical protein [Hydrogenimonas urashimensis]|nr:hypothetical protein [Hydrogenimonas urashimensis]